MKSKKEQDQDKFPSFDDFKQKQSETMKNIRRNEERFNNWYRIRNQEVPDSTLLTIGKFSDFSIESISNWSMLPFIILHSLL